jgi:hypothetical protein
MRGWGRLNQGIYDGDANRPWEENICWKKYEKVLAKYMLKIGLNQ